MFLGNKDEIMMMLVMEMRQTLHSTLSLDGQRHSKASLSSKVPGIEVYITAIGLVAGPHLGLLAS